MVERHEQVAIVGMACRFPGAPDVATFAERLWSGSVAVRRPDAESLREAGVVGELLTHPGYVPAAGALDGVDLFDAAYFGIAPADAASMDPQHRLFLQEAVHALDDAGWSPERGRDVGVFCGAGENRYAALRRGSVTQPRAPWDVPAALPLLVSYHLDLRGPSVFVSTLCSTSLVAVHQARRALLAGDCGLALAGGVSVQLPHTHGYVSHAGGVMSPSGRCLPFDGGADGTVPGSGVGIVVLKRLTDALRDGDDIRAVLRGSALNNDGADRLSFAAPSVRGQREAIVAALTDARVDPATIGYVEAHGTGTPLGDPVEISALAEARAELGARTPCAIGAVKSAIGHLDEAAGVAGLITATLSVREGVIPPTPGHRELNPEIRLDGTGLYVSTEAHAWPLPGPRRAAVTSLGVGGTNCHVVIEQAPPTPVAGEDGGPQVVALSAHTERSFAALRAAVRDSGASPAELAATLAGRRAHRRYRQAVVATSARDVRAAFGHDTGPGSRDVLTLDVTFPPDRLEAVDRVTHLAGDEPEPFARMLAVLVELGVRPERLAGGGAGGYLAAALAGVLPVAVALACARLHQQGIGVVTSGGDLSRCDAVLAELLDLLVTASPAPPACELLLRHSGTVLPEDKAPGVGALLEESRAAFMGVLERPVEPDALDVTRAFARWEDFLGLLAACWERGADVRWEALRPRARRVPLAYPFDGESHWALPGVVLAPSEPVAPTSRTEPVVHVAAEVAAIWREVLGVESVSPEDNFFALGGHSILAGRMLARLLDRLDVRCSLGDLLDAETLAGMTAVVEEEFALSTLHRGVTARGGHDDAETVEL